MKYVCPRCGPVYELWLSDGGDGWKRYASWDELLNMYVYADNDGNMFEDELFCDGPDDSQCDVYSIDKDVFEYSPRGVTLKEVIQMEQLL